MHTSGMPFLISVGPAVLSAAMRAGIKMAQAESFPTSLVSGDCLLLLIRKNL